MLPRGKWHYLQRLSMTLLKCHARSIEASAFRRKSHLSQQVCFITQILEDKEGFRMQLFFTPFSFLRAHRAITELTLDREKKPDYELLIMSVALCTWTWLLLMGSMLG